MNAKYRVGIYLRLSMEDDVMKNESNSISNQRLLLKDYIIRSDDLKKADVKEYHDDGYSGTNFNRPGITNLLEDVKTGSINCVIVKDFSRFARDYIELGSYLDQIFPFMGVRFISVNDNYDSLAHIGQTIGIDTQFKTLLYDFYSKDLSVKYKNAVMSKCEQGQYVFGRLPLGYEKIPNTKHEIRMNEFEASIVRRIFKEALDGKTTSVIAKALHDDGIPTCNAIRGIVRKNDNRQTIWQNATISKILNNRFYIGEWTYNKVRVRAVGSKKFVQRPRTEWKIVPNHHECIVDDDEFYKVRDILRARGDGIRKSIGEKSPLIGKVFCGGCGFAMTYKRRQEKSYAYEYLRCEYSSANRKEDCCTGFRVDILEELILSMLNKEILRLTEFRELNESRKKELAAEVKKTKTILHKWKKELEEKEEEKQSKYMEYADGKVSAEEYKAEAKQMNKECTRLSEILKQISEQVTSLNEEYHKNYKNLKEMIRYLGVTKLSREVVDLFIDRIYLYDRKRVEIKWSFDEE